MGDTPVAARAQLGAVVQVVQHGRAQTWLTRQVVAMHVVRPRLHRRSR